MGEGWITKMFTDRDDESKRRTEQREQELLRQKKIEAHAGTIWKEITEVLLDAIGVFNQRSPVRIVRSAGAPVNLYSLNFQAEQKQFGIVITFSPVAATISWIAPPNVTTMGTLGVNLDGEGGYSIHDVRQPNIEIPVRRTSLHDGRKAMDEVILGDFMRSIIS
jgi:hypothetical protein